MTGKEIKLFHRVALKDSVVNKNYCTKDVLLFVQGSRVTMAITIATI